MTSPPPGKRARSGLASLSLAASLRAAFCSSIASLHSHASQLSPSGVTSSLQCQCHLSRFWTALRTWSDVTLCINW